MTKVVFRVDASLEMGFGHVMRCLAIAQACRKKGYGCLFLSSQCPDSLEKRIHQCGHDFALLVDEEDIVQKIKSENASLLIVDGYHFTTQQRQQLAGAGCPVIAIDDSICSKPLHADYVLNPQATAEPAFYPGFTEENLLLGMEYLPLREEFTNTVSEGLISPFERDSLFISFGGTDPFALTLPVIEALSRSDVFSGMKVEAVLGSDNGSLQKLKQLPLGRLEAINLHCDVNNMAELMAQCGLAISAAGSTIWELAALHVSILPVIVADNQAVVSDYDFWAKPVDARQQDSVDAIIIAAEDLWQSKKARQHMFESQSSVKLTQGVENICEKVRQMIGAA